MKRPIRSLALMSVAALAAGLTAAGGTAAVASPAHRAASVQVLAKNLAAPLSAAVADDGLPGEHQGGRGRRGVGPR